jgi:hypothetical protein
MQDGNYLPKENDHSVLPQVVLRYLWNNKIINTAIGAKNEKDAREWFRQRPHLMTEFVMREQKLKSCIEELQREVAAGLRQVIMEEQKPIQFAKPLPIHRKRTKIDVNLMELEYDVKEDF